MSTALLLTLKKKHNNSLKHFRCHETNLSILTSSKIVTGLETLECRSIDDGESVGRLVSLNKNTLRSLRIGQEKTLIELYQSLKTTLWDSIPKSLESLSKVVGFAEIPNLQKLALAGVDLRPILPTEIEDALYLTDLQELTIESCVGTPEFLTAAASIFTFAQSDSCPEPKPIPMLEKFQLRHEASTTALKEALRHFLTSFSGLRMLSILLENGSISLKPADVLANHGSMLEQLVMETRIQPRELLRLDTSRPFGLGSYNQQLWQEGTNDICRLCPGLRELSIGFPWNDEMVRIHTSPLLTLRNLSTVHIRNFPESNTLLHMGDYTIKEYAVKFVEWTFGNVCGGERPQLNTLSIGPTIYESRFKCANSLRSKPPEFLQTHHFMVDWAQTRFGRWSAMVTRVSEKYMEEIRNERPLAGVFEQVWLR